MAGGRGGNINFGSGGKINFGRGSNIDFGNIGKSVKFSKGGKGNISFSRGGSQPSHGGGGGILGAIEGAGHWIGSKASQAGHDIEGIPGGTYHLVKAALPSIQEIEHPLRFNAKSAGKQWGEFLSHPERSYKDTAKGKFGKEAQNAAQQAGGLVSSAKQSIEHPLRDPFQTAMWLGPALHVPLRAAEVARRADVGAARTLKVGGRDMNLSPRSKSAYGRGAQAVYDKALQRALNRNPEGRLAGHAMRRIGGQIQEAERPRQYMRAARADALTKAGKKLDRAQQAALRLTSENITPAEARMFHEEQAAKGINPSKHQSWVKTYRQIEQRNLLTQDEHGNVIVNAAKHPHLAAVDQKLAAAQHEGEQIIRQHNIMSAEGAQKRINAPSEQVGSGRKGRGFVSEKQFEARAPRGGAARAASSVIGEARKPISSKARTGMGRTLGDIPDNTTRVVAQNLRGLQRYVNTHEMRQRWLDTSSATRRSSHDILIREPGKTKGEVPAPIQELLGRGHSTLDELVGASEGARAHLEDIIPGLKDKFASDKGHMIGEPAPKGFRWVDKRIVGDYANAFSGSRGKIGGAFDNLNSSITAATVYYKIGHVGTRFLTNAATNIIQGSAAPKELAHSYGLFKKLSEADRRRAWAAAGQHGFEAMPHEGTGGRYGTAVRTVATKGAQFWAHRADALFRFNSIAHEAAKAGYRTPAGFHMFLDKLEHPEKLTDQERARVESVAKRANREAIAYDRLSDKERRFISRAFWFYPWVKGSVTYSGRTAMEHPFKAAALASVGAKEKNRQEKALGGMIPSYEYGLTPIGAPNAQGNVPTTNLQTFSPFSTLGNLLQIPEYQAAAQNLNPAASALLSLLTRTNQYGQHSNSPGADALQALASATPEFQIASAGLGHKKSKMFPANNNLASQIERMLVGPAFPRDVNIADLQKAYGLEKSGR